MRHSMVSTAQGTELFIHVLILNWMTSSGSTNHNNNVGG